MEIKIKVCAKEGSTIPKYMTAGAAGADICANLKEDLTIQPFERVLVPTGLKFHIPMGYEVEIRPRSGLAYKYGLTLANSPGTIDSDYRGEIKIILTNLSKEPYTIKHGERVAQMLVNKVDIATFEEIDEIGETERGSGGFGHTGKK